MTAPSPRFTKDQLVFIVEVALTAVWDRIDGSLPDVAYEEEGGYVAGTDARVAGCRSVFDAFVPILYAQLTGEGLGIGDFHESEDVAAAVARFVRRKLDPKVNTRAHRVRHPDAHETAEDVVQSLFTEYLTPAPVKATKRKGEPKVGWDDEHDTPVRIEEEGE